VNELQQLVKLVITCKACHKNTQKKKHSQHNKYMPSFLCSLFFSSSTDIVFCGLTIP